ncbi:MAG TPA: biotin/lipoyl-containing protein, partial [Sediminibacterium sp.]|nr:biotin/lipoyl-containing protein [Sediminibacterium sp.]
MAIADLVMPKLGESIMEATILKWHKHVGDKVQLDETVLDIATDKVDSEVPSTAEGVITEILFQINEVVPIGTVIARIQTSNGEVSDVPQPAAEIPVPEQPQTAGPATTLELAEHYYSHKEAEAAAEVPFAPSQTVITTEPLQAKTSINRFYSPLVLNIANSEGIPLSELETIPGTGNEGRVTKKDILQYVSDKKNGKLATPPVALQAGTAPIQATARFAPTEHKTTQAVPLPVIAASG